MLLYGSGVGRKWGGGVRSLVIIWVMCTFAPKARRRSWAVSEIIHTRFWWWWVIRGKWGTAPPAGTRKKCFCGTQLLRNSIYSGLMHDTKKRKISIIILTFKISCCYIWTETEFPLDFSGHYIMGTLHQKNVRMLFGWHSECYQQQTFCIPALSSFSSVVESNRTQPSIRTLLLQKKRSLTWKSCNWNPSAIFDLWNKEDVFTEWSANFLHTKELSVNSSEYIFPTHINAALNIR